MLTIGAVTYEALIEVKLLGSSPEGKTWQVSILDPEVTEVNVIESEGCPEGGERKLLTDTAN